MLHVAVCVLQDAFLRKTRTGSEEVLPLPPAIATKIKNFWEGTRTKAKWKKLVEENCVPLRSSGQPHEYEDEDDDGFDYSGADVEMTDDSSHLESSSAQSESSTAGGPPKSPTSTTTTAAADRRITKEERRSAASTKTTV